MISIGVMKCPAKCPHHPCPACCDERCRDMSAERGFLLGREDGLRFAAGLFREAYRCEHDDWFYELLSTHADRSQP